MFIKVQEAILKLCENLSPKLRDYSTPNLGLATKAKGYDNVGAKN
jgi:hypothetical protein